MNDILAKTHKLRQSEKHKFLEQESQSFASKQLRKAGLANVTNKIEDVTDENTDNNIDEAVQIEQDNTGDGYNQLTIDPNDEGIIMNNDGNEDDGE